MLTDSCKWNCGKGGIITVGRIGVSSNKFLQGSVGSSNPGPENQMNPGKQASGDGAGNDSKPQNKPPANGTVAKTCDNTGNTGQTKDKSESESGILQKEDLHPALKCRECEDADNCGTLAEICAGAFVTSSAKLRKNYESAIEERARRPTAQDEYLWRGHKAHKAYGYAMDNELKSGEKWSYAAHHVLSGGQVVEKNKALLSLFKAFDYDINNVENCVMLLGKSSDVSLKDMDEVHKSVHKYDCMAQGRLQWHGGHHRYKFDKDLLARIKKQLPMRHINNPEDIKCYADLLAEKLEDLEERWNRRKKKICPRAARDSGTTKNSFDRRAKQDFFNDINRLAEEIRRELTEFSEKPHRSYPWYVSMAAWIYAFDLLHTAWLIAVTDNGKALVLDKFKLSRYGNTLLTKGATLTVEKKADFVFNNRHPSPEDISGLVNFCDNIIFFAIGDALLDNGVNRCLGFEIPRENIFPLGTAKAEYELKQAQTRLVEWIRIRANEDQPGSCGLKCERLARARETFGGS